MDLLDCGSSVPSVAVPLSIPTTSASAHPVHSHQLRGRSAELDGRRIHAVSPMYQGGETKILDNLIQEVKQQHIVSSGYAGNGHVNGINGGGSKHESFINHKGDEADKTVQMMLDNYAREVKLHLSRSNLSQQKSLSRGNVHKIEMNSDTTTPRGTVLAQKMSHSQPCLIAISDRDRAHESSAMRPDGSASHYQPRRSSASGDHQQSNGNEVHHGGLGQTNNNHRVPNNQKLIHSLREQNIHLQKEVENFKKKCAKLQLIETAYEKIEKDYEGLLRDKERLEKLEMTTIAQMEMHIQRQIAEKEALQERIDQMNSQLSAENLGHLSTMLADLIPLNKELLQCKERQKIEIDAQAKTLEEQRNHIAMLEKALNNAQERLAKRERTCEELSAYVDRAALLQQVLQDTMIDKKARDETHAAERTQWEKEMAQMRMQLKKDPSLSGSLKRGSTGLRSEVDDNTIQRLKKTIHGKDDRITQLETTLLEMERRMQDEINKRNESIGLLTESYETKIRRLEEERAEQDRKIVELTMKEKYNSELFYDEKDGEEDSVMKGLHKMEELKQKIQERKRKGRMGATGGLIGFAADHSRSSSGSILPPNHIRTSSGPSFEPSSPAYVDSNPLFSPTSSNSTPSFHVTASDGTTAWNV
ncbi:hypothetical protein WR25_11721 isoform A [Diploscapter pachys]|uniref:Angiomotin C-terminal domain-containing protein n=1 Tax=Diploscapter pachys TaxID=2018661 RepID=A0A2A2KP85_9BILA|nr:hypothetical protein WR25_11721 isoform A [Diploscapter pachys]